MTEELTVVGSSRTQFAGSFETVPLPELLQSVARNEKSAVLRVQTDHGDGSVWFLDGELIDAELADAVGEGAVYAMLMSDRGEFRMGYKADPRARRVERPVVQLLMEGMRLRDEWRNQAGELPAPARALHLDSRRMNAWKDELSAPEAELVARLEGATPLDLLADPELGDSAQTFAALAAIESKGLLADGEEAEAPGAGPASGSAAASSRRLGGVARHRAAHCSGINRALHILSVAVLVAAVALGVIHRAWAPALGGGMIAWALQVLGHVLEGNVRPTLHGPLATLAAPLAVLGGGDSGAKDRG